jgi:hypothetical protein
VEFLKPYKQATKALGPRVIFSLKIVELLGHYTLDEVAVGLELFCVFGLVKTM